MPLNEPFGKFDEKKGRFKNQVSSLEKGKCNLPKSFFKLIIAALESNRRTLSMIYDAEWPEVSEFKSLANIVPDEM